MKRFPLNNNKNKALLNKRVRFTNLLSHFYFDWNYYKSDKCGSFVTCNGVHLRFLR